ncbi:MAG TPA: serpin family protein, partial [Gemmatimonadaceae bacterium]|nr:serpin family protein [Gemmatimonadaceae bacterium]
MCDASTSPPSTRLTPPSRAAMYLIVPDSGVSLGAIERQFSVGGWPASLVGRDMQPVHLVLPKLHVEQSHDLAPLLDGLGAGIAFDCGRADFGNLAVSPEGGGALCLNAATQQVYLHVDEEGTEAAAVTGFEIGLTSAPPPPTQFIL